MTDIFIGAITYKSRGLHKYPTSNTAKIAVIDEIEKYLVILLMRVQNRGKINSTYLITSQKGVCSDEAESEDLVPYFDDLNGGDEEKLNALYRIIEDDFFNSSPVVLGTKVMTKRHPYNPRKDKLPAFYTRYYEKFVHIIPEKKMIPRKFDAESNTHSLDRPV